jgi:hypothetical protein
MQQHATADGSVDQQMRDTVMTAHLCEPRGELRGRFHKHVHRCDLPDHRASRERHYSGERFEGSISWVAQSVRLL